MTTEKNWSHFTSIKLATVDGTSQEVYYKACNVEQLVKPKHDLKTKTCLQFENSVYCETSGEGH
jgi:hypothetical protein